MFSHLNFPKLIRNLLIAFMWLVIIYSVVLFSSYLIPNELIMSNWKESVLVINEEQKRWQVMAGIEGTKLDTFTDNLIFQKLTNTDNDSLFQAAVWNNGYFRYWMGDIPILRLLLVFTNYTGIRYLNIFLTFGLLVVVYRELSRKIANIYAFLFFITLALIHFWIFPLSLQYTPVYVILMLAILLLIKADDWGKMSLPNVIMGSFIVGSITNYYDLLTAPMLTFGIPFLIWFVVNHQKKSIKFIENLWETFYLGISWLFGYALTWLSKWVLTSIVLQGKLQKNIYKIVFDQMVFRTAGSEDEILHFSDILRKLLQTMFPDYAILVLGLIGFAWLAFYVKWHKSLNFMLQNTVILLVGILPFIWFLILKNHSQYHYYFTYRNLAISVLAVFTYLYMSIDWQNLVKREKIAKDD